MWALVDFTDYGFLEEASLTQRRKTIYEPELDVGEASRLGNGEIADRQMKKPGCHAPRNGS
jgi:hypothetical protein